MKWFFVLGAILIALIVGWFVAFPSATVRYRLTLEIQVDGQPVSGSAVSEVTYRKNPRLFGSETELTIETHGEAVAVNLGSNGVLFALLKEGDNPRSGPDYSVLRAFGMPYGSVPRPIEQGLKQIRELKGKVALSSNDLPMLVRFRNIADPETVERIDPNDFSKSFGPAVKFVRATVEIVPTGIWPLSWFGFTGEPITNEIKRKLPWLDRYYDRRLDGRRFGTLEATNRLANSLSAGAFKTGR